MQELERFIIKAQSGDLVAYDHLVRRFQDMAVAYGYSILGDFHWAEDAAQEAFVEGFHCLPELQEPLAFPGWLRRIVFKHCDRLKRKKQLPVVSLDAALEEASLDQEPHEAVEKYEAVLQVRRAVATLPEHERSVTLLFYMGEHSQKQIAEFLEVPVTTVKKRLHTARKKLKEKMIEMVQESLQEQRPSKDAQFARSVKSTLQYRNGWMVLSAKDLSKALEFYHDKLGIPFDLVWEGENGQIGHIGSPLNLHFTTGKPYFYMLVEGIDELYQDYTNKTVNIIDDMKFNPHTGMKEFAVQDEDGNIIRFGQDVPEA